MIEHSTTPEWQHEKALEGRAGSEGVSMPHTRRVLPEGVRTADIRRPRAISMCGAIRNVVSVSGPQTPVTSGQ